MVKAILFLLIWLNNYSPIHFFLHHEKDEVFVASDEVCFGTRRIMTKIQKCFRTET